MKKRLAAAAMAVTLLLSSVSPASGVYAKEVPKQGKAIELSQSEVKTAEVKTAEAQEMAQDQEYQVHLEEGEEAWYKFIPESDGVYVFSSSGSADTYGQLYSETMKLLYENDYDEDENFRISYYLTAGTVYYLNAYEYSKDSASFTVSVTERELETFEIFYNENVFVTYGEKTRLEVIGVSSVGEVTYQWYRGEASDEKNMIAGAEESSYEVPADNTETTYQCVATSAGIQETAYFTLDIDTGLTAGSAIVDEDGNVTETVFVDYGQKNTLQVTAAGGIGNISYQWYQSIMDEEEYLIEGAADSSLEVQGTKESEGYYYCLVTDGTARKGVLFFVSVDTGLTAVSSSGVDEDGEMGSSSDRRVEVKHPDKAVLEVTAASTAGVLSYRWLRNGDEIEGAVGNRYEFSVNDELEGNYTCEVSDGINTETVNFFVTVDTGLKVESSTGTDWWEEDESSTSRILTVNYMEEVMLNVAASGGAGDLKYEWYRGQEADDRNKIPQAAGNSYTFTADGAGSDNYGNYYFYCKVSDGVTSMGVDFTIEMNTGLKAYSDVGKDLYGTAVNSSSRYVSKEYGEDVTLSVKASGGAASVNYKWYRNENPDTESESPGTEIENANGSSYNLKMDKNAAKNYYCEVTDGVVTKKVVFVIQIDNGLTAVSDTGADADGKEGASDNRNVTIKEEEEVTLHVTAEKGTEGGSLKYQWYRQTMGYMSQIEDAVGSSYRLKGDYFDAKYTNYVCRVTDGVGTKEVNFIFQVDTGLKVTGATGESYRYVKHFLRDQRYVKAPKGKIQQLTVDAVSKNEITYRWYRIESNQTNWIPLKGPGKENSYLAEVKENETYLCRMFDGVNEIEVMFDILADIDFSWDQSRETLTVGGTGVVPQKIFQYAGCDTEELKSLNVVVDDGVTGVEDYAFLLECKLEVPSDITLPASVNKIGQKAVGYWYDGETQSRMNAVKSEKCVVHCHKDTVSHNYAVNNGLKWVLLSAQAEPVDLNSCKVTYSSDYIYHTGKAVTPQITIKHGNKILAEGTDYEVVCQNNVNIGTAYMTITGKGNYTGAVKRAFAIVEQRGKSYTVGAYKYKIGERSEVIFAGVKNKKTTKVSIPQTVKIGGKNFKVTSIADGALKKTKIVSVSIGNNVKLIGNSAFENCSRLTKVTAGTSTFKIGKNAFKNCKKLKNINIKSTKLRIVGANALKGVWANAKIKVPAKKLKTYKKLLKGKGQGKKVKIIK